MIDFFTIRKDPASNKLYFLDQTRLPGECIEEEQQTIQQVFDSISRLKVRGAPAIGVAAAYGLLLGLKTDGWPSTDALRTELADRADYLNSSRPTAVNLKWALDRMLLAADKSEESDPGKLLKRLSDEAEAIHREDQELCRGIGEFGLPLIPDGSGVLTHCNAGALATTGIGTATAPMYTAKEHGRRFRVYADETRPLLQGARLTSWELHRAGIDVTVLCDNMAASVMASGKVSIVITGTDRVAANGDIANKIGTLNLAILADYYGIPFYIACPASTVDLSTPNGDGIVIEQRHGEEVRNFGERRTVQADIPVANPAFDVTPYGLISGIITEKGIVRPPYEKNLGEMYGS